MCICIIVSTKYTLYEINAVEKYTDFSNTKLFFVYEPQTTKVQTRIKIPHLDAIPENILVKRSVTISIKNSNITTTKPKNQKPATAFTTRSPQHLKFTKSMKFVQKKTFTPGNTTIWPKHSKRLGNDAQKQFDLKTPNRTDETPDINFKNTYPTDTWKDHGFYTDDYIKLINKHWFKFTPPNDMSHYILGFLYIIIMVIGCLGNFLVIFMYIKLVLNTTYY